MMLKGTCKGCGCTIKLDIGNKTLDEVKESLGKQDGFSCPGHHVELNSPYPHYWNIDEWELIEGSAPTDEEVLAELKKKFVEVIDTEEMTNRHIITGFSSGYPITNDGNNWNFTTAPSGKRFYYRD